MSKVAENSTTLNKKTKKSNKTLQELFRMALIKSAAFVVFEILCNLVSMKNFLNANNC